MSIKRISIDSLMIGMYITGFDQPWIQTPFLRHKFLLRNSSQIVKLRQAGIRFVDIDISRGKDVLRPEGEVATPIPSHSEALESRLAHMPNTIRGTALSEELHDVREARQHMLGEVREMLDSVRTSGVVDSPQVKQLSEDIISSTLGHEEAYAALIRTREFSPDLYEHVLSVGTLAVLLGRLLGYEKDRLHHLAMGALLHDIGMLKLPSDLLQPTRSRSFSEQALYEKHPHLGVEILKQSGDIPDAVFQLVSEHHRISNPRHYGEESKRNDISHDCQLIRVIDQYDEFLTGQNTKHPLPVKEALRELYQMGQQHQLNEHLVAHLISQIGIYPLYSLVQLNSGERGIVTAVTPGQLLRPVVLVIQDQNRCPYPEPMPINFSTQAEDGESLEIVKVLDPEKEGVRVDEVLADWVAL